MPYFLLVKLYTIDKAMKV